MNILKDELIKKANEYNLKIYNWVFNSFEVIKENNQYVLIENNNNSIKSVIGIFNTIEELNKIKAICENKNLNQLKEDIKDYENNLKQELFIKEVVLKNFKVNNNKNKGLLLKILNKKTYFNSDFSKVYYYYELVNKLISENHYFNFKYKIIMKYLNYIFDDDLNKWIIKE